MLDDDARARFRADGFVVLRRAFDPKPVADEIDRAFADGLIETADVNSGSGGVEFRCVTMTCERTPLSLALLDALAEPAAELLGRAVLPVRAKGTRYFGASGWHRDSDLDIPSIGFVAYLEVVGAESGALRVRPGSHVGKVSVDDAYIVATEPGDIVAFDEHLIHGSVGGRDRRQWRVDFVIDPVGADEEAVVRGYFARIYAVGWDSGCDVDLFPSYGAHWRSAQRPWTTRLEALGVYDRADEQEDAMRRNRVGG